MKRTPIARISTARRRQQSQYHTRRAAFLKAHPLCQAALLKLGIPEAHALANSGPDPDGAKVQFEGEGYFVPASGQVHHRNKRNGRRLLDERFWMAVSPASHIWIEANKNEARARGWLLDISANPDGMTPAGVQALTTDELFAAMGIIATQELPATTYETGPKTGS